MNVTLRRVAFEVRRDAAQTLSNGRIIYDALFTRTGFQTYARADGSISLEYRPPSEVFRADSLASLAHLPGVLLHPPQNFGTKFDGRYSVKGVTGDTVVEHTDHIHTAGTLCVWDDDWNAQIHSGETAELSCGYEIKPGPPGTAPDGTKYDVLHTNIVGDHMAGVPAGNAGTARVVVDAIHRVTREALADIAAARMDARPFYVDLGRWPTARENKRMDEITPPPTPSKRDALAVQVLDRICALGEKATPKAMADAFIEICGAADDPAIRAAAAALATAPSSAYVQAAVGPPKVEVEVSMQPGMMMDAAATERFDLAVADAADRRAELVELHRRALGADNAKTRTDDKPKTDAQIKREIIEKVDAARLKRVDAYTDARDIAVALDQQLAECREKMDADAKAFPRLLAVIEQTRSDAGTKRTDPTPEEKAVADRITSLEAKAAAGGSPNKTR